MFGLGVPELLIVSAVFFLLYGGLRLPGIIRKINENISENNKQRRWRERIDRSATPSGFGPAEKAKASILLPTAIWFCVALLVFLLVVGQPSYLELAFLFFGMALVVFLMRKCSSSH